MSRKDNRKFGDRCVNIASRSNSAPSRGLHSDWFGNQSLFSRVSISETAERERGGGKWNFDSFFFPKFSKRLFRNFDRNLFVSNPLTYNILFSNFFYSNADVSCWKILKN